MGDMCLQYIHYIQLHTYIPRPGLVGRRMTLDKYRLVIGLYILIHYYQAH